VPVSLAGNSSFVGTVFRNIEVSLLFWAFLTHENKAAAHACWSSAERFRHVAAFAACCLYTLDRPTIIVIDVYEFDKACD
jgi:hypothetical protein